MIRIAISEVDLNSNSEYVGSRDRRCGVIKRALGPRVGSRPTFATEGQGQPYSLVRGSVITNYQAYKG